MHPMLPVQIHLSHFHLSSLIHLLVVWMFLSGPTRVCGHPHDALLQPASQVRQKCLSTVGQPRLVCLCAASCSASIAVATAIGRLPPSMSQCRDKTLATFLDQQCLKTVGRLSLLKSWSTHLVLQQFLRLVV